MILLFEGCQSPDVNVSRAILSSRKIRMTLSIIEVRYITGLNDQALRAEQMKLVFQSDSISVLIGSFFFFFLRTVFCISPHVNDGQSASNNRWCRETFSLLKSDDFFLPPLFCSFLTTGDHRNRLPIKDDVPGRPNSRKTFRFSFFKQRTR